MVTAIYPFIFIINHFPCFQNSGKQVETPVKVGYGKCFSILGTVFPCRTFKILNLINGYLKKELIIIRIHIQFQSGRQSGFFTNVQCIIFSHFQNFKSTVFIEKVRTIITEMSDFSYIRSHGSQIFPARIKGRDEQTQKEIDAIYLFHNFYTLMR